MVSTRRKPDPWPATAALASMGWLGLLWEPVAAQPADTICIDGNGLPVWGPEVELVEEWSLVASRTGPPRRWVGSRMPPWAVDGSPFSTARFRPSSRTNRRSVRRQVGR